MMTEKCITFLAMVYTFVADPKNLRWEVYKPLTTKNLHYPVTVNNEDELLLLNKVTWNSYTIPTHTTIA